MKTMIKKLCSIALTFCLLVTIFASMNITAHAASGTYGNLSWNFTNGTLTISGYGDMKEETTSSAYPWSNYRSVTKLVIKDGVTSIAPRAFFMLPSGKCTVELPLSLRYVGHRAFYSWGYNPDIYYAGSLEDRKALLSWDEWNHGLSNGTWHYSSHSHQWTLKSTTAATCTANGVKTYTCHCGSSKTEQLSALGHNYSGSVSYNWTQVNGNYQVSASRYCARNCGQRITETVTAQQTEIKAATCTANGQIQCTATFSNSTFSTQTKTFSTPMIGHTYKDTVTASTCTEKGFTTHTCHCGHSYVDSYVDALGHKWNAGVITTQPNCTEKGVMTYTCTTCSSTKTEPVDPTGHTYQDTVTPPTCTEKGFTTHTCHCGYSYVDSYVDALGHKWNIGVITTQPTCMQKGIMTYTCTTCSSTKTEPVDPTGHTYKDTVTAPTCTEKGFTTHTCHCGNSYVDSYVDALGHNWNSGAVTKQPTCKEDGIKTFTCRTCNAERTEKIEKLKIHTYDNECDAICNVCNASRTITHQYNNSWYNDEMSCWNECTVCGEKKDVKAHIPGEEATETTPQVCTNCGYIIKPATGHITHQYDSKWTTDKNAHWHRCTGCEEKDSYASHVFENACDKDCDVCGFTRETKHKFAETWTTDADQHWHECIECGFKQDEAAHEPGPEATATTAQSCTICKYEIAPAFGEPETDAPTETIEIPTDVTELPSVDEPDANTEQNSYWWILIAAMVVLGIGAITFVIVKKKRVNK